MDKMVSNVVSMLIIYDLLKLTKLLTIKPESGKAMIVPA